MSGETSEITDVISEMMDKVDAWNSDETAVLHSESSGDIPLNDRARELLHAIAVLCLLAEAGALALDLLAETRKKVGRDGG